MGRSTPVSVTLKEHGADSELRSVGVNDELLREIGVSELRATAKSARLSS